jgi:dolichol kinase
MKEEKIKSLKQELKSHITPLIFNGVMSISQILILILFLPKFNGLMIFGLVGIGFGTGLSAIVHALEISDIKKSLKSYTGGE